MRATTLYPVNRHEMVVLSVNLLLSLDFEPPGNFTYFVLAHTSLIGLKSLPEAVQFVLVDLLRHDLLQSLGSRKCI